MFNDLHITQLIQYINWILFCFLSAVTMNKKLVAVLLLLIMSQAQAGPLAYLVCVTACHAALVACCAGGGVAGAATGGVAVPAAIVVCEATFASCVAACTAAVAIPIP